VNPKSLPASGRQDKLIDRGRVGVFVGYEENTIKQFRVYAPDLDYVIRSSIVTFDELEKGGTIDLRFRSTRNTLPDRKPRDRPRNKMPESVKQKTVPKPSGQSENQDTNRIESRLTISVKVPKKSVT
jgi:hypothetical protein